MYKLYSAATNKAMHSGTLIECLRLASHIWRCFGQISITRRPDGTDIWHTSDRMIQRLPGDQS